MTNLLVSYGHELLKNRYVYDTYQSCVGSVRYRKNLISRVISQEFNSFLDLGCGTASTLDLLPSDSDYTGVDISKNYLARVQKKNPNLKFILSDLTEPTWIKSLNFSKPTICIALGLFHHLDDKDVSAVLAQCVSILPKGSKIFSMDPVIDDSTSFAAKWFALNDRGKYVRTPDHLESLFTNIGLSPVIEIKTNQMRIPLDTIEITFKVQ